MKITKKYRLELSDFMNYSNYAVAHRLGVSALLIVAVAFIMSYFIAGSKDFLYVAVPAVLISELLFVPISFYTARKSTADRFSRSADEDIETTIDKRGFSQKAKSIGKITVPLDKLYKVCESRYGVYVYVSSRQAIILPKRIFGEDELSVMKEIFEANMPEKKVKFQ